MNAFTSRPGITVTPSGRKYRFKGLIAIEPHRNNIHIVSAAQGQADAHRRDAIKRAIGMKEQA